MKIINLLIIFVLFLFSPMVMSETSQLNKAISHAEEASNAKSGKEVATHAQEAKASALEAKQAGNFSDDAKYHLEAGIISLEHAIENGKAGMEEKAHQQAADAVKHFKEIKQ